MNEIIRSITKFDSASTDNRTITFVMSTDAEDRSGDRINQSGWLLDRYKTNPVLLWSHMSHEPAIGKALEVGVTGGRLVGTYQFATAAEYPFADQIFRLYVGGYLSAGSVGFTALDYEVRYSDGGYFEGIDFQRQELTEFSACSVPCNPEALSIMRSLGAGDAAERLAKLQATDGLNDAARKALVAAKPAPIIAPKALPRLVKARAALSASRARMI